MGNIIYDSVYRSVSILFLGKTRKQVFIIWFPFPFEMHSNIPIFRDRAATTVSFNIVATSEGKNMPRFHSCFLVLEAQA